MSVNKFIDKWLNPGLFYSETRETALPLVAPLQRRSAGLTHVSNSHQGKQGQKRPAPLAKQQMSWDIPAPYPLTEDNTSSNSIYSLLCSRFQNLVRAIEIWQRAVNRHQQHGMTVTLHITIRRTINPHMSWGGTAACPLREQSHRVFLSLLKCLCAR